MRIPNLALALVGLSRFFEILDVLALEHSYSLGTPISWDLYFRGHYNSPLSFLTRGLFRKVTRKRDTMASHHASHDKG